MDSMKKLVN